MKHNWQKDENGNVDEWAWGNGFHNGVFCVDCGKSVCVCCNPNYMDLDDCTGPEKLKPMTNADHIRHMSDEELAKLLLDGCQGSRCIENPQNEYGSVNCFECRMKWLQQPAEEDTNA